MATRLARALVAGTVAAVLVAGTSHGFGTAAWETTQSGSGAAPSRTMSARLQGDAIDPDPPRGRPWTSDATPAMVAINVVANYCTPTPCRPR